MRLGINHKEVSMERLQCGKQIVSVEVTVSVETGLEQFPLPLRPGYELDIVRVQPEGVIADDSLYGWVWILWKEFNRILFRETKKAA